MDFEYLKADSIFRKKIDGYLSSYNLQEIKDNLPLCFCRQDNEVIGLTFLDTNPFHPYAYKLTIHVKEIFRRQGIGSELIKCLKEKYSKAYRVIVDSADKGAASFLAKNGFDLTLSCFTPQYTKKDLICFDKENDYQITPLSHLNPKQFTDVKKLLHINYKENHFYNKLNEHIDYPSFFEEAAQGYAPNDSYAIIKSTKIAGYILSFVVGSSELEIGYVGKYPALNENFECAFYNIITKLFDKYEKLSFEIDSVDLQGMEVLNFFKEKSPKWDIYFKRF